MTETAQPTGSALGWTGFVVGSAALILTIVVFWAGPFAPQQAASVSIGELAADIAKSAARSVAGLEQPAPQPVPRTIDDWIDIGVGVLAGLAIVIGAAALVRHERKRAAISGIALGGLAIGFQLFAWTIMSLIGGLVLVAVIYALRDAFGDIFGGLFGG